MTIAPTSIGIAQAGLGSPAIAPKPTGLADQDGGFADKMGDAIKSLADSQKEASDKAKAFEMGVETDLASVMVAQQVSSLGFQMALQVRNKALGAYRDIMNMPV